MNFKIGNQCLAAAILFCCSFAMGAAEVIPPMHVPNSHEASKQHDQMQQELNKVLRASTRWPYDDLQSFGWRLTPSPGLWGDNSTWPYQYDVVKKGSVYGVVVTLGAKSNRMSRYQVPFYEYKRPSTAFLVTDIPNGYVPVNGCQKISDWNEVSKRCKASKGEDCSFNKPDEEMVAFVRMPSRCAQLSTLIHSAYRYSGDPSQGLIKVPVKGMQCVMEAFRAEDCPTLTQ